MFQLLADCPQCPQVIYPSLPEAVAEASHSPPFWLIIAMSTAIALMVYFWLSLIEARGERDVWINNYSKIASQLTKVKEALK